jgi:DNA-binding transcriptional LysR family regulator
MTTADRLLDLRALEALFWVAKLGGFGRAAAKLNTTQPAISSRIASLEAEYGVRLLAREPGSRPSLTPLGLLLSDHARRMLSLRAETASAIAETAGLRGPVRIGVSETLVHILLPELLRRLHAEHPKVTPNVVTDVSPNLRSQLSAGELDLALMLGPSALVGVQEHDICSLDLVWAASPGLPIRHEALTREAIGATPILTYAHNTKPCADLIAALEAPNLPAARIFPNSSLATMVNLAKHGVGIAVIPQIIIQDELKTGDLCRLSSDISLPPLRYVACWLDPGPGLPAAIVALTRAILADKGI